MKLGECTRAASWLALIAVGAAVSASATEASQTNVESVQLERPTSATIRFSGSVRRGSTFTRRLTDHLTFRLRPIEYGWRIEVVDDRLRYELARQTPPFHGPNPTIIEGWHFRNRANTGPNTGDMNFPQKIRDFIFSSRFEQAIEAGNESFFDSPEQVCEAARDGHGTLKINRLRLGNLVSGKQAWIDGMQFRADIRIGDTQYDLWGDCPHASREK